jgi:hypothetical protein
VFSCVRNIDEDPPLWLEKRIEKAEKGLDIHSTYSIWKYVYNNQAVYYFNTYFENEFNYLYDKNGNLLGAPNGGSDDQGDKKIPDFFSKSRNMGMVWEEDDEPSLNEIYDYWFFNNMLNFNFGTPVILLQRETMYPNFYDQILDTLRSNNVNAHYMTVASYNLKNSEQHLLVDSLLSEPIECISKAYIDSVLTTSGWEGFAALHPDFPGYCEFALPAYDPVDSIGLFVFAFHFGEDKRYWRITLGELIDEEWQLMQNDSTGEYYVFDNDSVFGKPTNTGILKEIISTP